MPVLPNENRDAEVAVSNAQQVGDAIDAEATPRDDTTLKFTGRIAVTDEDVGGDPYNHAGRFRRVIR